MPQGRTDEIKSLNLPCIFMMLYSLNGIYEEEGEGTTEHMKQCHFKSQDLKLISKWELVFRMHSDNQSLWSGLSKGKPLLFSPPKS